MSDASGSLPPEIETALDEYAFDCFQFGERHSTSLAARAALTAAITRALHDATRDAERLTRVEVIDQRSSVVGGGRVYVLRDEDSAIDLSWQDDRRTLKVFIGDRAARAVEGREHA